MAAVEIIGLSLPYLLLLVGAGLIIAEAFIPGAHFFVVGVALFAAGLVGLLIPASLGTVVTLLVMTAVVLVSAAVTLYGYRQLDLYGGEGKDRTSDSASLRGQVGRVTERVTPQDGEVKLEDGGFNPYYRARSVDGEIPVGEEVMVVDPGGGNVLTVESFGSATDEIDRELARSREETESERETESESSA
ncbi:MULTISPECIES: NfeD family protein [Salinibaculum]|uniref:NfeD family protein n=1 Tax=Salinibaculum TaxID=2732368 RepID=UPI0030D1FC38